MKIEFHVQPSQYEFIGFSYEETEGLSDKAIDTAISDFNRAKGAIKGGEGMNEKEMDIWVYNMLLGKGNDADVYQKATPAQQKELHRIKRALAKIKRTHEAESHETSVGGLDD